jgi:hypothetical protein
LIFPHTGDFSLIQGFEKQYFCGNYCGPNWCRGTYCQESKAWGDLWIDDIHGPHDQPTDAIDDCCRIHDFCCHHDKDDDDGEFKDCNLKILNCMKALDPLEFPVVGVRASINLAAPNQ